MYIPTHYKGHNIIEAIAFMKKYSFAQLITTQNDKPFATHLPVSISELANQVLLTFHLAKANPQSNFVTQQKCLIVFVEPHAYISPTYYSSKQQVPTWNYIAVHAYGKATPIKDLEAINALLEQSITQYDPSYLNQWQSLSSTYKTGMVKAIAAFEIKVEDLEFKKN